MANEATLSGALDILVVRKKVGSKYVFGATPVWVRFGKLKVLNTNNKHVFVRVNDSDTPLLTMEMTKSGLAVFNPNTVASKPSGFSRFISKFRKSKPAATMADNKEDDNKEETAEELLSDLRSGATAATTPNAKATEETRKASDSLYERVLD